MLAHVLASRRVVVCVGSGGAGKTTVSAAFGVAAAMAGRKALVLTIDPARRLANSLGMQALGNVETRVGPEQFARAGLEPRGELWAMTLDLRRTWDDLVTRHAPTREQRERILTNRLYRQLSTQLAGSLEYMAMEKVFELAGSGDYDLVVLDTPPTAHALDFLHAPDRILGVLDHDNLGWLARPMLAAGRLGLDVLHIGSTYVARTLSRFTGTQLLQELADFVLAFQGMYDGFRERATRVKALLSGPDSAFVLVTGAHPLAVDEAIFFAQELRRSGIAVAAAVANRVVRDPAAAGGAMEGPALALALARARVANEGAPRLSDRVEETLAEMHRMAEADRVQIGRLREAGGEFAIHVVPRLERDVHDLAGLHEVHKLLLDGGDGSVLQAGAQ